MLWRLLSSVLLAVAVSTTTQAGKLQDVTIGITPAMSTAGLFVAYEKGYFKEQGINLVMKHVPRAGAQMVPFLATGQLMVGCGNLNPGLYSAVANGIGIEVVADKGTVSPDHGYLALIVRKELVDSGKYKGLEDLKGKTVALTARGVSQEIVLEKYLQKAGLTLDDVKIVKLSWGDMNVALSNGAIDATIQVEPLVAKAVENNIAVRVMGDDEIYPNQQSAVIMYSPMFTKNHPELAKKFMVAYVKGMRDYYDGFERNIDKEGVIKVLMKHTKVKVRETYDKVYTVGLHHDAMLNVATMRDDANWLFEKGYIKQRPNVDKVANLSYVEHAIKVLGPYRGAAQNQVSSK